MRKDLIPALMMIPLALLLLSSVMMPTGADGDAVVVDKTMITYDPEEPLHSDEFNVTVEPVLIDAEPIENGVLLMWSLCTEEGCGVAQPEAMTDNGDGTWSAVIGPFDEKHPVSGLVHQDILFRIKITAAPTGGGDDIVEESESVTVYFDLQEVDDDDTTDDDTGDDDDDDDDSPFGIEIVIIGVLLAAGYFAMRRRN